MWCSTPSIVRQLPPNCFMARAAWANRGWPSGRACRLHRASCWLRHPAASAPTPCSPIHLRPACQNMIPLRSRGSAGGCEVACPRPPLPLPRSRPETRSGRSRAAVPQPVPCAGKALPAVVAPSSAYLIRIIQLQVPGYAYPFGAEQSFHSEMAQLQQRWVWLISMLTVSVKQLGVTLCLSFVCWLLHGVTRVQAHRTLRPLPRLSVPERALHSMHSAQSFLGSSAACWLSCLRP